MPIFQLPDEIIFPPPNLAEPNGLLAVGGDLSVSRLIAAYRNGIFPWFSEDDPILWWFTSPRLCLAPEDGHRRASSHSGRPERERAVTDPHRPALAQRERGERLFRAPHDAHRRFRLHGGLAKAGRHNRYPDAEAVIDDLEKWLAFSWSMSSVCAGSEGPAVG